MACSPVHARKLAAYWFVSVGTLALQYAFSIIFVDLLEAFDGSRAATALVGSTCAGVMDMMGYASGVAVARRGERTCGAAGAVISGGALVLASRAGALWHLFVTYGLVLGVGQSLALNSGVVCCNQLVEISRVNELGRNVLAKGNRSFTGVTWTHANRVTVGRLNLGY